MKAVIRKIVPMALCSGTSAYAASKTAHDGTGLFFWLFIALGAMIVTFQFLPGITTFLTTVKELFTCGAKEMASAKGRGKV